MLKGKGIIILIILTLIILGLGYHFLDRLTVFHISKVAVSGIKHTEKQDIEKIEKMLKGIKGKCILKVSLSDLYQGIKTIGWIKNLSIRRVFPNMIRINIEERWPVGIINCGGQGYLVDGECVVIAGLKKQDKNKWNLPLIKGLPLSEPPIGQGINSEALKSALTVLTLKKEMKSAECLTEISELDIKDPDNIILYGKDNTFKIRLGQGNFQEKITYLQKVWKDIKSRATGIEYIDLRYKDKVVVKPQGQIS